MGVRAPRGPPSPPSPLQSCCRGQGEAVAPLQPNTPHTPEHIRYSCTRIPSGRLTNLYPKTTLFLPPRGMSREGRSPSLAEVQGLCPCRPSQHMWAGAWEQQRQPKLSSTIPSALWRSAEEARPPLTGFKGCPLVPLSKRLRMGGWEQRHQPILNGSISSWGMSREGRSPSLARVQGMCPCLPSQHMRAGGWEQRRLP